MGHVRALIAGMPILMIIDFLPWANGDEWRIEAVLAA